MTDRTLFRLKDIALTISDAKGLMSGKSCDDLLKDRVVRAAFERFLEIISEASRHIPDDLKARHPNIPWREIAGIGNHLRHAYHSVDPGVLWDTYQNDLNPLEEAVLSLIDTVKSSQP